MSTAEIDHLSYSSISTYLLCAKAWEYRYVAKVKTPSSPNLVFGSALHGTVEQMILKTHAGEACDVASLWTEQWGRATDQEIDWDVENPDTLHAAGLAMATHPETVSTVAKLTPLLLAGMPAVERRVELHVPGVPIKVIGYIDLITADGVPCDFKTAAKAWTQDKAEAEEQPSFYLAALNQDGYNLNPDLKFRHIVWVKGRQTKVQVFETQRPARRLFRLFDLIGQVWRGIEAGCFPANTNTWKCSPKWCEFWDQCPYGGAA